MFVTETIDAYRNGKFEADLVQMSFSADGEKPLTFNGPGTIRQRDDGTIEIKCFAPIETVDAVFDTMNRSLSQKSGQLFGLEHKFAVEMVGADNVRWTSEPVLMHPNWNMPEGIGILRASPGTIRGAYSAMSARSRLTLYFLDQETKHWSPLMDSGFTLDVSGVPVAFEFVVERDADVVMCAEAEAPFPEAFERRLLEALQFALCKALHPTIADHSESGCRTLELRSRATGPLSAPVLPPVPMGDREHVIGLLQRYLDYVHQSPDEGMWHPVTNFLTLARNASGLSLDAWALGLGVAVEGIASQIEIEIDNDQVEENSAFRTSALAWMKERRVGERLSNRIGGMLAQLNHTRPHDRLEVLARRGLIERKAISAWKSLRNKAVHTRNVGPEDMSDAKLQAEVNNIFSVLQLLHMIVFGIIGYTGPMRDYGRTGWPSGSFPPISI